jgi:hypothetical protein
MARDEIFSIENAVASAEQATAQGRYADAEWHYRRLIAHSPSQVIDYEYEDWARRLAEVYVAMGRGREAAYLLIYLHYFPQAEQVLPAMGPSVERALIHALQKRWVEAAGEYLAAGRPVQAAVAYEEARDHARARELWARLATEGHLRDSPYERALVHFNLGLATQRTSQGGADGHAHLALAQRLLEQVADDFETRGERERAFDCYQILLKLGRDSGSFENLSEGYLNCIRVLKEDGLKFYVLQYYEDFLKLALEREEYHAAATLFREAAQYAMLAGLPYHRHYLRRSAETWWRTAEKGERDGSPMDLVENAYLASVECWSAFGDFQRVKETYGKLADLDLPDRKQKRYAAIGSRFSSVPSESREAPEFPDYLRQPHAYADIWFVDLVEWELDGDPDQVAAMIVGDLRYPDSFRRRALNLILHVADARSRGEEIKSSSLARVAELLGDLQSYAALKPLERLYEHPDVIVRRAAVRALRSMHFKRSFGLITRALADADPSVREFAVEALRGLNFPHAFHPLARIYREHPDERVKAVALESLGRIGSIEAGELLVGVVRHEQGALRDVARRALANIDNADVIPIVRQHHDLEANPDVRRLLSDLIRGHARAPRSL